MKIEKVIKQLESILDHTRSMAASPDADNIWRKDIDALEFALTALRSMSESGEYHFRDDTKLSLEQLKQMDGKPVWIEDTSCWGLVFIPKAGQFKNSPFVLFRKEGVQFEWHVTDSELTIYSYPPAHIDRSEWEKCELCSLTDGKPASRLILAETCNGEAKYCPRCGRPLAEEAWAELERRLRG